MAQSVRVFQKNKIRLDRLNIPQRQMYEVGQAALNSIADRLQQGKGPNDGPAKPLKVSYAVFKSRKGKGNKRDLFFTGQLLRSTRVRTVTDNRTLISVGADARSEKRLIKTTAKRYKSGERYLNNRDVARANQLREPWLAASPRNRQEIRQKVGEVIDEQVKHMVISSPGGTNG